MNEYSNYVRNKKGYSRKTAAMAPMHRNRLPSIFISDAPVLGVGWKVGVGVEVGVAVGVGVEVGVAVVVAFGVAVGVGVTLVVDVGVTPVVDFGVTLVVDVGMAPVVAFDADVVPEVVPTTVPRIQIIIFNIHELLKISETRELPPYATLVQSVSVAPQLKNAQL